MDHSNDDILAKVHKCDNALFEEQELQCYNTLLWYNYCCLSCLHNHQSCHGVLRCYLSRWVYVYMTIFTVNIMAKYVNDCTVNN